MYEAVHKNERSIQKNTFVIFSMIYYIYMFPIINTLMISGWKL